MRLDKFLKVSRVIKRRTVANEACDNGRVSVNGRVAKAGTAVKPGDVVQVEFAGGSTKFEVLSVEDNVKKSGAAEMYRIITSLALIFFICIGFLTGCSKSEIQDDTDVPLLDPGESYTLSVGNVQIYDEQFCYFFSMAANELSNGNYSNEWMVANLDAALDRTLEICQEHAALYDQAVKKGFNLTDSEYEDIMLYEGHQIEYNLGLAENEYLNSYDEVCIRLSGMNYAEYRRYIRLCQPGEKLCRHLIENYNPSEEEQLTYYQTHAEQFQANSVGKIYISEANKLQADQVLDMVRNKVYPFTIIARGWSEDESVLKNDGCMDLCVSDDTVPDALKEWILECEVPISEENAVMIHIEGDGYYILINKGRVGFSESASVKMQVLDAMKAEMLSEYKEELVKDAYYSIREFDREKAIVLVKKFAEGRQQ